LRCQLQGGRFEELNLHFNSVKYRVGRAVARRGREIGSDRLDVELAFARLPLVRPGRPAAKVNRDRTRKARSQLGCRR
jgi:hypothetical protein